MANITVDIVINDLNDFASSKTATNHSVVVDDLNDYAEYIPAWTGDTSTYLTIDRAGTISGTVKVQGVLQVKSRVNLYYRKTGQLIQSTFTNADGVFLFKCGLNRSVSDYYAVAMTDQPFNAQIFDKLTPA